HGRAPGDLRRHHWFCRAAGFALSLLAAAIAAGLLYGQPRRAVHSLEAGGRKTAAARDRSRLSLSRSGSGASPIGTARAVRQSRPHSLAAVMLRDEEGFSGAPSLRFLQGWVFCNSRFAFC